MYDPVKDGIEKKVKSVIYLEDRPASDLFELVHCFWELKTAAALPEDFHYHVIPDACVNILFDQVNTSVAAVTSLHTEPKKLNLGKAFHYVGIQFLPGVWRGNPGEIRRGLVNSAYEGELPLIKISEDLANLDFPSKKVVLSKFVEYLIDKKVITPNIVTAEILKNINSIYSVADMASFAKLSSRQLQRVIKQSTGFSPHDFLKILRVQQSFKEDYLTYYADQSHFIHSFRKITGYTPSKYNKKFDV